MRGRELEGDVRGRYSRADLYGFQPDFDDAGARVGANINVSGDREEIAMMLEELTAVATLDLPVREFADHLKLGSGFADDGSEDAVLEVCLRSAMAAIEVRIGKALMMRSFRWDLTRGELMASRFCRLRRL